MVCVVTIVAARTGIHACNQHERTRILYVILGSTDSYLSVFQRLTKHLQYRPRELWHLVKKENSIMGEADFPRLWVVASANEGNL